ncbi:hypothetical protein C8F04DRAFT_1399548 [Mycena alexandri]|uniref:Uncharacterized protein n=1 Tax=Mycena alexandri TaxID=1745969 RepID=A0AAD6SKM7_9AGAR|nr:hypothetical protein C8F04DRAFT_1399548 [Mycena alexandri]
MFLVAARRTDPALIGGAVASDCEQRQDPLSTFVAAGRHTNPALIGGAVGSDGSEFPQYFCGRSAISQQVPQFVSSSSLHPPTTSFPSSSPLSTLPGATDLADPKEFPLVRWWNRRDFTQSQTKKKTITMNSEAGKRGGSRAAKNINVMHQYLENEDGTVVSGLEAKAMRKHQRTIFREIRKQMPNELPTTWGNASLPVANYHRSEMYKVYPSLRFCRSHWKVDLMATTAYPSWYKKSVKNKQDDLESDSDYKISGSRMDRSSGPCGSAGTAVLRIAGEQ